MDLQQAQQQTEQRSQGGDCLGSIAITGFILSILGFASVFFVIMLFYFVIPFQFIGFVVSAFGIKSSKRKLAVAGMIISILSLLLSVLLFSSYACHLGWCIPFLSDFLLNFYHL